MKAGGRKTFEHIEKELLNGQKLQGTLTVKEVMAILRKEGSAGAHLCVIRCACFACACACACMSASGYTRLREMRVCCSRGCPRGSHVGGSATQQCKGALDEEDERGMR